MIIHRIVLGALQTNCYLWADEKTKNAIVIDPADNPDKIIETAQKKGFVIKKIILTHGHFDHMLGLSELKEKTGATLSVYEKTQDFLTDTALNLSHYADNPYIPSSADEILCDGDIIDFYGNEIKVIHTPGHTNDSICLLNEKTLISGDTLFNLSVGRSDFPTGNMHEEIASIKDKLMLLSDDTIVHPGHGFSTTIGKERTGNPYII